MAGRSGPTSSAWLHPPAHDVGSFCILSLSTDTLNVTKNRGEGLSVCTSPRNPKTPFPQAQWPDTLTCPSDPEQIPVTSPWGLSRNHRESQETRQACPRPRPRGQQRPSFQAARGAGCRLCKAGRPGIGGSLVHGSWHSGYGNARESRKSHGTLTAVGAKNRSNPFQSCTGHSPGCASRRRAGGTGVLLPEWHIDHLLGAS